MDTTFTAQDNAAEIAHLFAVLDAPELRIIQGGKGLEPANDVAVPVPGVIRYAEIRTKKTGEVEKGYQAEIIPGVSVRLFGVDRNGFHARPFDITFSVGDSAIHGRYNVAYVGVITKIGPKTITIQGHSVTRQLDLCSFAQKNWNYSVEKVNKERSEWMD